MKMSLDDIRKKLAELSDAELGMSILDYINSTDVQNTERAKQIDDLTSQNTLLKTQNGALYARVLGDNTNTQLTPDLTKDLDEEAILNVFNPYSGS